jgi:hypothetical protein
MGRNASALHRHNRRINIVILRALFGEHPAETIAALSAV